MKTPLLLQTPAQHDYKNPAVELNPKRLAKWLKGLPLLNLAGTIKELLDALEPCNRQAMPAKTRIRLLELYYPTVVDLFNAVEDDHLRRLPLSSAQRAQVKADTARLCQALGEGYKILVAEFARAGQQAARHPLYLLAIHRAMNAGVLTLLHAFRTYESPPSFTYLDLNQLYGLAEAQGAADTPVIFEKQTIDARGVGAVYKQIMLLTITDPFHLSAGVAIRLYERLGEYAAACTVVGHDNAMSAPNNCFVVDLEGDSPPVPGEKASTQYETTRVRRFDIRPALERVHARLHQLAGANTEAKVDNEEAQLLRILAPELEKSRVRKAPRKSVHRQTRVTFGLDAIHYFLSKGSHHLGQATEEEHGIEVRDLEDEAEGNYTLGSWTILNESVNGYLLANAAPGSDRVRIGDCAGLVIDRDPSRQAQLNIAVVRWMRVRPKHTEIGVELLPGKAAPVQCQCPEHHDQGPVRGLFLPSLPALGTAASLMMPKRLYSRGRTFDVHTGDKSLSLRAGHLIMDTAHFDRFEFTTV